MAGWTVSCHVNAFTGGGLYRTMLTSLVVMAAMLTLDSFLAGKSTAISDEGVTESRHQRLLVWVVVVVAVVLTMIAHRPDQDDCQWISWAEAAVSAPQSPILENNTMNAPPWTPLAPAGYRFHSFEVLAAALSKVTSVPTITIFHLFFAPFAAAMAIFSYRRLMRILSLRFWGYGVLAVFVYLCANGSTHHSWGNFSFVRLHQAKGILVTVILPLVIVFALRWSRHPTLRNWILLAASQIVALGASFTALFIAPPVAILAVVAGLPVLSKGKRVRRLVLGLLSSSYLVVAAIVVKLTSPAIGSFLPGNSAPKFLSEESLPILVAIWTQAFGIFGRGPSLVLAGVMAGLAWFVVEGRTARRLWMVFTAGLLLLFFNPVATSLLVKQVTGFKIYWRILWILPFPALIATVLLAPLSWSKVRWPAWLRYGTFGVLLVLVILIPRQNIFAKGNRSVHIGWPGLKVTAAREVAAAIADLPPLPSGERRIVVGPSRITEWLPTFPDHPFPLIARKTYFYTLGPGLERRIRVKQYVTGKYLADGPNILRQAIRDERLSCVCLPGTNKWAPRIREVLVDQGFEIHDEVQGYEIWAQKVPFHP